MALQLFRQYFLPAVVFQTIIIAGGYGTGQEFIQFFLKHGPAAGLLGLVVAALCWSLVCMLSYDCARRWQAYDYRTFFKNLLGNYWVLFEISYLLLCFVVLSVVAASVGSIGLELLGLPYNLCIAVLVAAVAYCVFVGSRFIEYLFSVWSFFLFTVYLMFLICCFQAFGNNSFSALSNSTVNFEGVIAGISYSGYNLGLIPAVLFSLRYIQTRRQALTAGMITGVWAVIPGMLFYFAMLGQYPQIMQQMVPSAYLLGQLDMPWLSIAFALALLGTLIETAIGLVHAVNLRLVKQLEEQGREYPKKWQVAFGSCLLLSSMGMAQIGLADLIASGYGILTWVMIAVYIVPLIFLYRRHAR